MVGIYQITNTVNGKRYIGQSINISKRKSMHFYFLKSNTHINKHLQSSYNKYGKDSFLFEVLLLCDKETLTFFEQLLVDGLDPEYNICKECVDSPKGRVVSEETKQKRREAGKFNTMGRPPGFVVSEETRQKMSKTRKGVSVNGHPVICTITGRTWRSAKDCLKEEFNNKYCMDHFRRMLRGKKRNMTSIIYLKNQ